MNKDQGIHPLFRAEDRKIWPCKRAVEISKESIANKPLFYDAPLSHGKEDEMGLTEIRFVKEMRSRTASNGSIRSVGLRQDK